MDNKKGWLWSLCKSKKAYNSKPEAMRAAKYTGVKKSSKKHGTSSAYQCDICHKWHIGRRYK